MRRALRRAIAVKATAAAREPVRTSALIIGSVPVLLNGQFIYVGGKS